MGVSQSVAMMRTTWLSTAARRGLLPSLRIRQFSAPLCRVQFCANVKFGDDAKFGDAVGLVDAAKLVAKEYAELELDSIENQVSTTSIYIFLRGVSFACVFKK